MVGIIILSIGFLITYLLNEFTNLKPLININDSKEILPIFTANLFADCLIIYVTFSAIIGNGKPWQILTKWYKKYRLSAVIADVLILVIGMIITRYIFKKYKWSWNLIKFLLVILVVQIVHDYLFYLFFKTVPVGKNKMLDVFKKYASEVGVKAILGDSFMIIISVLLSSYFSGLNLNNNLIILTVLIYLVPYFIFSQ